MEIIKKDKEPKHHHNFKNTYFWFYAIDYKSAVKNAVKRFYGDISVLSKLAKDKDFFNRIKGIYFRCIDVNGELKNEFYVKPPFRISQRWHYKPFYKGQEGSGLWWEFVIRKERGIITLSSSGGVLIDGNP